MSNPRGVDLSHHNQGVDFGTLKRAGISFVGLKATEGTGYTDDTFVGRRGRARAVGFERVLLYHFVHADQDPMAQAQHFAAVVGRLAEKEGVVLDIEEPPTGPGWTGLSAADSSSLVTEIVFHLKTALGIRASDVMLYGSIGWLRGQFGVHLADLKFMPLWVARYNGQDDPGDVSPWPTWTVHQQSERGTVAGAGAAGTVDTDVWNGQIT